MKTGRQVPADTAASRRAQPVRQTRTNPARAFGGGGRSLGARGAAARAADDDDEDQHEIYPAITHFADAITALPKELVRHFTLLKEVDAKIFAPEETLGQMVDNALKLPLPEPKHNQDANQAGGSASINGSINVSINGSMVNEHAPAIAESIEVQQNADVYSEDNLPRRQLFRQLAWTMQEMLVSLDEKNHVISTATEALDKHVARLKNVMPHVEGEVSEEARWGSTKHWAYADNRIPVKLNERSKREKDNVNALSRAAAEAAAEEAKAKADRKQPARDKKSRNQQHQESDFDDHDGRKGDKRVYGNAKKSRQSDVAGTNGGANGPPPKRRKVDKEAKGGAAMERSESGAHGSNGHAKGKNHVNSTRETPIPEPKKRAKPSTTNGQPRKRTAASNVANTPYPASSPISGTFGEAKSTSRISPPPPNGRPTASRGRQNSLQSTQDSAKQRPPSSASNKPNGNNPDVNVIRPITSEKATKDTSINGGDEEPKDEAAIRHFLPGSRKESSGSGLKHEDSLDAPSPTIEARSTTAIPVPVTTKSGRASKPQTPAIGGEKEGRAASRRSTVGAGGDDKGKRSHKKGHGAASAAAHAVAVHEDEPAPSVAGDEEEPIAEDEPRYCYCNGVSYGEMVACDADGCAKEWFHLECVGLRVAPKGNAKWYCDDCKENMRGRRVNGR